MRLAFLAFALAVLPSAAAQSYADFGIALRGPEGARAVLLQPADDRDGAALVRLERTGTELDGVVLPATYTQGGGRETYSVRYHGRDWALVTASESYYGKSYEMHLPGRRSALGMAYDDELSEAVEPAALVAEQAEDTQAAAAVGRFDRAAEEARAVAVIDESLERVADACGVRPEVVVDWSSVSDENLTRYAIGSFGATPLDALARACDSDDAALHASAAGVRRVTFAFGAPMTLALQGGTLAWATNGEAPNQEDFAYNVVLNALRENAR